MGTPHRGSNAASWGLIAANITKAVFFDVNKELLRALNIDGTFLEMVRAEFAKILRDGSIKVHSFREERGFKGVRGLRDKVEDPMTAAVIYRYLLIELRVGC